MGNKRLKAILKTVAQGAAVLLFGAGVASAQSVSLTAAPSSTTLPDGTSVPMWGYTCGATSGATCAALNPTAATAGKWSPIVITVPYNGSSLPSLTVSLTNGLPAPVPTSITIVGQIGGGLGTSITKKPSPLHDNQGTTWPIANTGPVFTPPTQEDRVQSFATEVASGATNAALTWSALRPGTYLIESGTHPSIQAPMGLYGILVVTKAPVGAGNTGLAYTGVNYSADLPLLLSEIDPVQNQAVATAVATPNFSETATLGVLMKGPVKTINLTNPGQGYSSAPTVNFVGGQPSTNASATAVIDSDPTSPTFGQITGIDIVSGGNYVSAPSITITGGGGTGGAAIAALQLANNATAHCSGGAAACYPPAVNYTPLYYMINGASFDKTNSTASLFKVNPTTGVTGDVLVRMVNAGLRMHVPSIVGAQPSSVSPSAAGNGGFSLIAEDGNTLPGVPRIQSEVFMAAGKTYDVLIKLPTSTNALPVFDRQLSLSSNAIAHDSGMLGYISVNGAGLPVAPVQAQANPDTYKAVIAGQTLTIADPSKGVLGNDVNVFGVKVTTLPGKGTVTLNPDGTFTYVASGDWSSSSATDSFGYCGNGALSGTACTSVSLQKVVIEAASGITCSGQTFNSSMAKNIKISAPGVLAGCVDGKGFPLTVNAASVTAPSGLTVSVDANGAFKASATAAGAYSFSFKAQNSQGTVAAAATTVNLTFPQPSNLNITVLDGADHTTKIAEYRWVIEEDRTFFVDPKCMKNPAPAGCSSAGGNVVNFGTNFHTSYMPLIASGCNSAAACGNDTQSVLNQITAQDQVTDPKDVGLCNPATPAVKNCLDPNKRYYISVLPADAAQPFINGYAGTPDCSPAGVAAGSCGHGMGGAPIPAGSHSNQAITIYSEPSPYPPATLSGFVFEDDYPLNGEVDTGGGVDIISPNEPGLGGFQITISDNAGGTGDSTGTPTYDMFNMPLSNSLAGTLDPVTGKDACPISGQATAASEGGDSTQNGIVGMIVTCPKYESDGTTMSPLAGQFVVKNLWAGRYGVTANPGADRIARGEEWLQTNTLDGQKAHDSFMRIGEPGYFQEFGPAGYHVTIGFANPKFINDRLTAQCAVPGADCTHEVKGHVTTARMSRTPDERLYGSGTHDAYGFTQCYISLGDPDGADFAFTKCNDDGSFDFTGIPAGNWKITTFDQWNDQVVDGITTPVGMCAANWNTNQGAPVDISTCVHSLDMGEVAVHQWQADIYTRTFLDTDSTGVSTDQKPGLSLVATNIRFRDGSFSNFNSTDLNGFAGFNEVFPLFNWYVVETDTTRYKSTGTHVIYDSGGPADNTKPGGAPCYPSTTTTKPCGNSQTAANLANTYEPNALPADLSLPGTVYCDDADCTAEVLTGGVKNGPKPSNPAKHSTGRIDAPWVEMYGWQGFSGQANFLEFGKKPFADGENGGIHGHVVYASTRPFDDPMMLLQLSWEPLVPHVRINLYKEGLADDNVTKTLTLVDHTETTSFDDWSQGVRADGVANMNCPGQGTDSSEMKDPYYWFGLKDQPQWLDIYNNGAPTQTVMHDSQFKCYDGMHNWNQLQPAPYDGYYSFPSVTGRNPSTGNTTGTNCSICVKNPDTTDSFRYNKEDMLPDGKYVVEVVVPPGYELVKEEDKNILIGDNFIAPSVQQFGGLGSIFILPDQAEVLSAYNANNGQNATNGLGRNPNLPSHESDTGSDESYWPCVGEIRTVPDFISLFPGSGEVAPFAGAKRPLCDRKEVMLSDQTTVLTKFYVFTPTHVASHFTGQITDDFAAEFDPYSPAFGEKFAPAYLPVGIKDWAGNEINRVYADAWGVYNGLNYSTWEVNPPNPTGYGPTMMVTCMNDPGPVADPNNAGQTMTDPMYQSGYSDFCYQLPFMPGQTGYFDTPVVPTSAFAGGYNTPDCSYPDATPAVSEVDGDGVGPWVAGVKGTVISVAIAQGGSGYTTVPGVHFNNLGTNGSNAAATAQISGSVLSVSLSNGGRGYTSIPSVTFTGGGGGSGATASANMTASVTSVTINSGGSYGGTPTVTFNTPTGGVAARGTVQTVGIPNTTRRRITGINITNPGSGYSGTATMTLSFGGTPSATWTVNMGQSVASVTVVTGGSGYTSNPTVTIDPSPFTAPRFQLSANASGSANDSYSVVAVLVSNGGSGYSSAPQVTIDAPTSGTRATANASIENNGTLTIKYLGDQNVDNYLYSGPSANVAPFNQQRIKRHYGFGAQCTSPTAGSTTCNTASAVTIGGVTAPIVSWDDTQIVVSAPSIPSASSSCQIQQQSIYRGSTALCGELTITAGNGKQSIDTVTVTIGGKVPTHIAATESIQAKIDAAQPGDLLIIDPTCMQKITATGATSAVACGTAPAAGTTISNSRAAHAEMLLMWKPVRLQGVGAASSVIDANPHPAGKLDPWRRQIVCLFGLSLNGTPISDANPFDSNGTFNCTSDMQFSVDRLPLEATVGWDASLNGNLAEQLIEPTIMGAYEGAGITVLSKGVKFNTTDPKVIWASDTFPTGTQLLTSSDCLDNKGSNPYPSNFLCNPSSIDGLTVENSSQGGGGIMVHGWGHDLQIANNRVYNNQGTMSGGITIGQGEHPDAFTVGNVANTIPGSCIPDGSLPANMALPYCNNMDVNVHNNWVVQNSSLGDELFSSTPAGAGGVTFCNGSDYYKFQYNWICGNMSTGDGAGVAHLGFSYDGDIEHNTILYNQSTNPTIVTNGGGLLIMGAPDVDPACGITTDVDCISAPSTILPSDGTGPALTINANLIMGNSADSGSGGGLRLQHINGNDVLAFPKGNQATSWPHISGHGSQPAFQTATPWNAVQITNNIIANNVAGIDGGGVSLLDALAVDILNNTIVSNDSTASSGVLLQTLFAPLASTQGTNCTANNGMQSCPQVAGLVSVTDTDVLTANMGLLPNGGINSVTCPSNHGSNRDCTRFSVPMISNNIIWKNRSLMIGVGGFDGGFQNQQNQVTLINAGFGHAKSATAPQTKTGECNDANASYWDIGVRGDSAPGSHQTMHVGNTNVSLALSPAYTILSNVGTPYQESSDNTNVYNPGTVINNRYCNGSRLPIEAAVAGGAYGWQVPPGTNESNALPAPPFTLSAAATVDEGNNWINLRWGPLSMDSTVYSFDANLPYTSSAIDKVPSSVTHPPTDFFGNARPNNGNTFDIGAIETKTTPAPIFSLAAGTYHSPQILLLTDTMPTAVIYYTIDGSTPTTSSTQYVGAITIAATETVKAIAVAPGYQPSPVSSKAYVYQPLPPAAAPSFSLAGGSYNTPQQLFLTDTTPGASIYYTTDGSTPTTSSTHYTGAITVASTELIKAIATAPNFDVSPVSSKQYTYAATQAPAPVFSLATGTYQTPQTLTITDSVAGATIYYTTNGTTPTTTSTRYLGSLTVQSTETVKAVAIATGYTLSTVTSVSYTYNPLPAATAPSFSLAGGHYTTPQSLTLTDTTPGATIYYTTNGTTPTTSSNKYTGPITVNGLAELVQAIAVAPGYNNSPASSKLYFIF